jgi:hypothetical protein
MIVELKIETGGIQLYRMKDGAVENVLLSHRRLNRHGGNGIFLSHYRMVSKKPLTMHKANSRCKTKNEGEPYVAPDGRLAHYTDLAVMTERFCTDLALRLRYLGESFDTALWTRIGCQLPPI